jgi:hypothetical protein
MSAEIAGVDSFPGVTSSAGRPGNALPMWRDDASGPSFGDLLDALNPLQHIPIVSSLYRAITGDQIGHIPRVLGDTLFGGPVGMLVAGVYGLIKEATGGEPSEHVVALFKDIAGGDETAVAAAKSSETKEMASGNATPTGPSPVSAMAAAPAVQARQPSKFYAPAITSHTIRSDVAERERQRIVANIYEAERAQSKLLLTSVGLAAPSAAEPSDAKSEAKPARHTNLPPADASSDWVARAMERGLRKYDDAARARPAGPAAAGVNVVE